MGRVAITVLGPISADKLGITLPHEHILIDVSCWWIDPPEASKKVVAHTPVSISNLGVIKRDPFISRDNLVLLDIDVALKEIMKFKRAGGNTITDVTNLGIGRDPLALKGISIETGLNIIMGSGYYIAPSHPSDMDSKTVEEIAEEIVRDITVGVSDTGIRAGIIGEIGTSFPITENEKKVLRAAAIAQRKTGASLTIHPYPWGKEGINILDIVEEEGADLNRVIMCHLNSTLHDLEYHKSLARRGCYVEYDNFGLEFYFDSLGVQTPRDTESIKAVKNMIDAGFLDKILISQDIALKIQLTSFGGWGYAHILNHIVPMLKKEGVTQREIDTLVVENPKRAITFDGG